MAIPSQYSWIENINSLYTRDEHDGNNYSFLDYSYFKYRYNGTWGDYSIALDKDNLTYISFQDTFNYLHEDTNSILYMYYWVSDKVTISLVNDGSGGYDATYSGINIYTRAEYMGNSIFGTGTQLRFNTDNGNPYITSYTYEYVPQTQAHFSSLNDALEYIYLHYANIILYVDGEQWVPAPPAYTSNGGGATHIAKRTGQLKDLSSYTSDILIVSGGGGGGLLVGETDYSGKEAGGISGSGDNSADQTTGNAFGLGESGTNVSGGGSGLYGGYKGTSSKSGGAGSGYIGNSLLSNKKMVGYNVPTSSAESTKTESVNVFDSNYVADKPKAGNGHARIKFLSDTYTDGKIIAITTKTPSAWVSVSTEDNDAYVCIANLNGTELQAIKVSDGITIFNKLEPTTDRTSYLIQFDNLTEGQTYKFYLKKGNARTLSIQRQVITRTILFSHSDLITFANNHSSKFVFGKQSPTYSGEFISFTINNNYLTWNGQCDSYTNTDIGAGSNRLAISVPNDATRMAMLVTFKRIDSANLHNVSVINHIQVCNSSYRRLAYVYYKTLIEKDNEIILVAMIDFDNLDIVRSNIAYICIRMDNTDNDFTNTVYNIQMSGLQVWAE